MFGVIPDLLIIVVLAGATLLGVRIFAKKRQD